MGRCGSGLLLLWLLALSWCPRAFTQATGLTEVSGTATVFVLNSSPPRRVLQLELASGAVVRAEVEDPSLLDGVLSGQMLQLTGMLANSSSTSSPGASTSWGFQAVLDMRVTSILPLSSVPKRGPLLKTEPSVMAGGKAGRLTVASFTPRLRRVKVLMIPVMARTPTGRSCPGVVNTRPYTLQGLARLLKGAGSGGADLTLKDVYASCSHGKTRIDAARSKVADFVYIPCTGRTKFGQWKAGGCEDRDTNGMTLVVDESARKKQLINYANYDSIVYLLPANTACSWAGMGTFGCMGSACKLWANSYFWDCPMLYLHEQGHQFSLMHAAREINGKIDEYGDHSGAMGVCCGLRCHNTPHSWQMGWLPVTQITSADLGPGETLELKLEPQSRRGARGLRVVPDWVPGTAPLFAGYRDMRGTDIQLESDYAFKTNIYQAAISFQTDGQNSLWLAAIDSSMPAYRYGPVGLTFRHLNTSSTGAWVSLCRDGGPETLDSCCKGQDLDCNSLAGADDPGCSEFMPKCSKIPPRQAFTIRQHTSTIGHSCAAWQDTARRAWMQAALELTGLNAVSLDCTYLHPVVQGATKGKMRIVILGRTPVMDFSDAKALGQKINRGVNMGTFAGLVKEQDPGVTMLPRKADGWCMIGENSAGLQNQWLTQCPPSATKKAT